MVLLSTQPVPLYFQAPSFVLPEPKTGKDFHFEGSENGKGTLIFFICNHCPYVIHLIDELVELAKEYQKKGFNFIAISSNDIVTYPQDAPEKMISFAKDHGFSFPYLYDESQHVAKKYHAECTPDFNLINPQNHVVYRGRFDESRPGSDRPVTGNDLRNALDRMLSGKPQEKAQHPSMGCSIKWKK